MKRHAGLIGLGLILIVLFLGHAAKYYQVGFVTQLENILYDARLRMTMPGGVDDRIVILDIDEKSLQEEGHWPWSRDRLALLVDKLFDRNEVAIVGFDVVFPERDFSSGIKVLQDLERGQLGRIPQYRAALTQLKPQLDYDGRFASSLSWRNVVLGYYFTNTLSDGKKLAVGALPEPLFSSGAFEGRKVGFTQWNGYGANLPELVQQAAGAGHFNPLVDPDGVVRRTPVVVEHEGAYYESLALAVMRTLLGTVRVVPGYATEKDENYSGLEWFDLVSEVGRFRIPVDQDVGALIPYRGDRDSFNYISATDVLHDRVAKEALQDRIVLVGTSAPGLMDMRATPVNEVYPGVEVHANMIAGIIDQNIKQRPSYVQGAEVVLLLITGLMLCLVLPFLSPARAVLFTGLVLVAVCAANLAAWQYLNLVLPLASGILMILTLFALDISYGYLREARTRRQITGKFSKYVPAELVEEMIKHPEQVVSMEGESREMTILFSDVRGFTTISEGLDPRTLSQLMNEFLTPLSLVVKKHNGKVDKYMGDCIMAFWGAPSHDPMHARNAMLAALEMQSTLAALQPQFRARGWPEIQIGIGVNTGKVSVGNMGSEVRVAYTVMGDAVNLASRLEGITKQYGVVAIVGENTRNAVDDMVFRELDWVRVKGKDKPVAIYEPIGLKQDVAPEIQQDVAAFAQFLVEYRKQNWDEAERMLQALRSRPPESGLYEIYAERINWFRAHAPGPNWDGVFVFETK